MKKILKSLMMLAVVAVVTISLVACGSKGPDVPSWMNNVPSDKAALTEFAKEKLGEGSTVSEVTQGIIIATSEDGKTMIMVIEVDVLTEGEFETGKEFIAHLKKMFNEASAEDLAEEKITDVKFSDNAASFKVDGNEVFIKADGGRVIVFGHADGMSIIGG